MAWTLDRTVERPGLKSKSADTCGDTMACWTSRALCAIASWVHLACSPQQLCATGVGSCSVVCLGALSATCSCKRCGGTDVPQRRHIPKSAICFERGFLIIGSTLHNTALDPAFLAHCILMTLISLINLRAMLALIAVQPSVCNKCSWCGGSMLSSSVSVRWHAVGEVLVHMAARWEGLYHT